MKNEVFQPLLFAGDINVYSVARAFHEAYGVKSICYGKFPSGPAYDSKIIDYRVCKDNEDKEAFCQNVLAVAEECGDKKVILLGCGDSYVQLAAENKDSFPQNVVAPYVSGEMLNELIHKEKFYLLCEKYGLDYPTTFIHRKEMPVDVALPFGAPYVCKPANGVAYWAHPFEGNDKVFICKTREKLSEVLEKVYASGYDDSMIIQDFIPGDDSFMRVLTNYSDGDAKVKMQCLGHVLLEEHTPHGIGNHAVIMTEENPELCEKIRQFLEEISFVGFSNFDIKFDSRDGKYKVFEINCRQGRSNYYVTGAGYNIAQYVVKDRILGEELPYTVANTESLWSVVPKKVMFDYIVKDYHSAMEKLIKAGKLKNPQFYAVDNGFGRRLRLLKNQLGHFKKYKEYYEKKS